MNMSETQLFAKKHTHALAKLGYQFLVLDTAGEIYQSTIKKYLIERSDGSVIGNIAPKKPSATDPVRRTRARKRRLMIQYDKQTNYIARLKAMRPSDVIPLKPPVNVSASAMQHAVHSACLRVFGKGNFETAVADGQVLVFYKGSSQTVSV